MTEAPIGREPPGQPFTAALPYAPQSASAARRLVHAALADWKLHHLTDDAALVVTELVSNAARTGGTTTMQVTVGQVTDRAGARAVRISVRDGSRALPVPIHAGRDAESGRGLLLVDRLTVGWGTDLHRRGKTTWAELAVEEI